MEVNVAGKLALMRCIIECSKDMCSPMQEPRSRIVRNKTYSHHITYFSHTYGVSPDWVDEVRCTVSSNSYNSKIMLCMQCITMENLTVNERTHSVKVYGMLGVMLSKSLKSTRRYLLDHPELHQCWGG